MKKLLVTILIGAALTAAPIIWKKTVQGVSATPYVESVDLERYLGTWKQIITYPQFFERGCIQSIANYSLLDDGKINVKNTCQTNRGERSIEGTAKLSESQINSQLKVSFFRFVPAADYWIIELDENYNFAIVSNPRNSSLFVLSRSLELEEDEYVSIIEKLKERGFDESRYKISPNIILK